MVVVSYDPRWKRHSDTDAADAADDSSFSLSLSRFLYRYLLFIYLYVCALIIFRKVTISNNNDRYQQRVYRNGVPYYRYRIDSWPELLSASFMYKDEKPNV